MEGFTDIHAHFLYGLDDGAKDHQEMEAMLDAAHADGIVNLFATPHVTPGIEPFCKVTIDDRLTEARSYCQKRDYQIRLYSGAEILYTPALEQYMTNHQLPSLGDEYHVLVEFVPNIEFVELEKAVLAFERYGYVPILAHVERYRCLYIGKRAEKLKRNHNVYLQELPAFDLRLQVKAGLTGYAQIYGRYNTEPQDKLKMDLMYINHASIAEDVKLILATIRILFLRESTSSVAEGQITASKNDAQKTA